MPNKASNLPSVAFSHSGGYRVKERTKRKTDLDYELKIEPDQVPGMEEEFETDNYTYTISHEGSCVPLDDAFIERMKKISDGMEKRHSIGRTFLAVNSSTGKELEEESVSDLIDKIIKYELDEAAARTEKRVDYAPERVREIYLDEIHRHFNAYEWRIKMLEKVCGVVDEYEISYIHDHVHIGNKILKKLKSLEAACEDIRQKAIENAQGTEK